MCFRSDTPDASGGILFLACQKKVCKKETLGTRIALTRLKKQFVTLCVWPLHHPLSERPSGGRPIGFPKRTMHGTSRFICAR